jgi:hypothetical protein
MLSRKQETEEREQLQLSVRPYVCICMCVYVCVCIYIHVHMSEWCTYISKMPRDGTQKTEKKVIRSHYFI